MADKFSLSEVFRMAEEIERNGAQFYAQAAESVKDQLAKDVFLNLRDKEKQHEKTFADWREYFCSLDDTHLLDPDGQVQMYLQAVADNHVFNLHKNVTQLLASVQTTRGALRLAIGFEKDTIVFFAALKDAVTDENRPKVELLIAEEIEHIRQLNDTIKQLPE
ncbi:MAG: ferritin family protein [Sedimentisphaerales bacterium]|nr:ferritin family protein [Sedimentisphaerales bacterium]